VLDLEHTRRKTEVASDGEGGRLERLVFVLVESAALYTAASIAFAVEVAAGITFGNTPSTRFAGGFFLSMAVRAFHRWEYACSRG
jgi:hypothetical protein